MHLLKLLKAYRIGLLLLCSLAAGCSNSAGSWTSQPVRSQQGKRGLPRSPEQALKEAQGWVSELQDVSKASHWRDTSQAMLVEQIKALAPAGQADLLAEAQAAVRCACTVVEEAKAADKKLGQLIENAAKCAIHCRKAAAAYTKVGASLAAVQKRYAALQQNTKKLQTTSSLTLEEANSILADLRYILEYNCMDIMIGDCHVVSVDQRVDPAASELHTDRLLGKGAKKIARAAQKAWIAAVINRPSKPIPNPTSAEIIYKFDLTHVADKQALAGALKHVTILLIEALKAHYEARGAPEIIQH